MNWVKSLLAGFMLTCMYVCGLTTFAAVYTNLTIYPSTLSVSAGEDVIFSAKTDETDTDVSYQWSIDGVTIDVETPGLHLAWDEYITYFPTDAEDDAQRTVTVATIDDREMIATDSAQLLVNHGVCGDGVVDTTEECDDGNLVNGDSCSETCLCEGVCMSFLL